MRNEGNRWGVSIPFPISMWLDRAFIRNEGNEEQDMSGRAESNESVAPGKLNS